MMKGKIIIAAVLLLATLLSAQYVEGSKNITCTLVNSDSIYIYVVRGTYGATDLDSVLTTLADVAPSRLVPPTGLLLEPTAGAGMAAGETDSLLIRVYPLMYDWADGEYAMASLPVWYVDFSTTGHLVPDRTALDWDSAAEYYVALSDSTGKYPFASCSGVVLQVIQMDNATGNGAYTIQPVYLRNDTTIR
jgi:hypothetical protein